MTKSDLIKAVSQKSNIRSTDVSDVLKALEDVVLEAAQSQEEDRIILGWCTVKFSTVPSRERRNPKTGETFTAPEHAAVKIKPSLGFKKLVAGS